MTDKFNKVIAYTHARYARGVSFSIRQLSSVTVLPARLPNSISVCNCKDNKKSGRMQIFEQFSFQSLAVCPKNSTFADD